MSTAQHTAITGASGMIGTRLTQALQAIGHRVSPLIRSESKSRDGILWDPAAKGICEPEKMDDVNTVVHLAGENIAAARWTDRQKEKIRASRVDATRNLVRSLAELSRPPATLVSASAIGYYGDRGDEELTETSPPGDGFLSDVCREWEAAAADAVQAGIRVVHVRIGVVLSTQGGALAKMLTPFRLGLGGVVGSGRQYWSWIGITDLVHILREAVTNDALRGPVNAVSPNPVTNREFTMALGRVLKRPTIFPLPAFVARLMLGEMADELLLASNRVLPKVLTDSSFEFDYADIESCLRHELGAG